MKRFLFFLFSLTALLLFVLSAFGCASADFDVIIGTDLHYISPSINDNGEYFMAVLANGDGKLAQYAEEITEAFLFDVIDRSPSALILTGDLTFNGAAESHRDLAEKLRSVEKYGIPVFVTTGNHDLYNRNAALFSGNSYERLTPFTSEDFRTVYEEFGFDEALSADSDSLSYLARIAEDTLLLMLDFNTLHDPCGISEVTLRWVEEQLNTAQKEGMHVLAAGHQNLFQHSMFVSGYMIGNSGKLLSLFEKYGVELFLSGHLHIQHIVSERNITEIATSALCLSPCHYGVLQVKNGEFSYHTERVPVSRWAEQNNIDNTDLLSFDSYSEEEFDRRSVAQAERALENRGFTEEEKKVLIDYAVAVQRGVFSGDQTQLADADPDGRLAERWRRTGTLHGYYLSTAVPEPGTDHNVWGIP